MLPDSSPFATPARTPRQYGGSRAIIPSSVPFVFDPNARYDTEQLPKEPKRLSVVRWVLVGWLIAIAVILSTLANNLIQTQENAAFARLWDDAVHELSTHMSVSLNTKVLLNEAIAAEFAYPPGGQMFFPKFEEYARLHLKAAGGIYISLIPIVYPEERQAFEAYIRENFFSELSKGQAFVGMPPAFFEKVVVPRFSNGIQDGIFTPTDDPSKPQGYYVPADEAFLPKPKGSRPFFAVVLQNGPFMVNPQPALANNMNLTQRVESLLEIMETGRSTTSDLALYTTAYMGGLIKSADNATQILTTIILSPMRGGDSNATDPALRPITGVSAYSFMWLDLIDNGTAPYVSLDLLVTMERPVNSPIEKIYFPNVFTLQIARGRGRHKGWGDLREKSPELNGFEREFTLSVGGGRVHIKVSPTAEFLNANHSRRPRIAAMACVLFMVVPSLVFIVYDIIGRKYRRAIIISALQTRAWEAEKLEALRASHAFASIMNHEVLKPCEAIVGGLDALYTTNLSDDQRSIVAVISGGADQIIALAEDSVEANGGGLGKFRLEARPAHIRGDILSPSWLSIRLHSRFTEKVNSLNMNLAVAESVPDRATLDAAHARVVCSNLVATCVDNAPEGGEVELRADFFPGAALLQVAVRGSGPGLTAAEARLIFHPFGSTGVGRFGRAGRSLVVARGIARAMGGDLALRPTPAAGGLEFVATFHVRDVVQVDSTRTDTGPAGAQQLAGDPGAGGARQGRGKGILKMSRYAEPFGGDAEGGTFSDGPAGPVEARLEDGTRASDAAGARRLHALVGEDDPLSARMTKVSFALAGMTCEIVGDGLAVTAAVAADPMKYDLILLDDHMGGLERDGLPTLSRLRLLFFELGQQPPPIVTLVSAGAPEEVRALFASSGAASVLTKPLTVEAAQSLLALRARRNSAAEASPEGGSPGSRLPSPPPRPGSASQQSSSHDPAIPPPQPRLSASSIASGDSVRRLCSTGVVLKARPSFQVPPLARRHAPLCANCQHLVAPQPAAGGAGSAGPQQIPRTPIHSSSVPSLSPILAEGRPRDDSVLSLGSDSAAFRAASGFLPPLASPPASGPAPAATTAPPPSSAAPPVGVMPGLRQPSQFFGSPPKSEEEEV